MQTQAFESMTTLAVPENSSTALSKGSCWRISSTTPVIQGSRARFEPMYLTTV